MVRLVDEDLRFEIIVHHLDDVEVQAAADHVADLRVGHLWCEEDLDRRHLHHPTCINRVVHVAHHRDGTHRLEEVHHRVLLEDLHLDVGLHLEGDHPLGADGLLPLAADKQSLNNAEHRTCKIIACIIGH